MVSAFDHDTDVKFVINTSFKFNVLLEFQIFLIKNQNFVLEFNTLLCLVQFYCFFEQVSDIIGITRIVT